MIRPIPLIAAAMLLIPFAARADCEALGSDDVNVLLNVWDQQNPEQFEYYWQVGFSEQGDSLEKMQKRMCQEALFVKELSDAERSALKKEAITTPSENLILEHALRKFSDHQTGTPPENDLKSLFAAKAGEFQDPPKWVLRYVSFPFTDSVEGERNALLDAKSFWDNLTSSGLSFDEAANLHWKNRKSDGRLNPQTEEVLQNTVLGTAVQMDAGESTGPVRAKQEFVLFKVQEILPSQNSSFDATRPKLEYLWKHAAMKRVELEFFERNAAKDIRFEAPFLEMTKTPKDAQTLLFHISGNEPFTVSDFRQRAPLIAAEKDPEAGFFLGALYEVYRREALQEPDIREAVRRLPLSRNLFSVYRAGESAHSWRLKNINPLDGSTAEQMDAHFRAHPDQYTKPSRYWATLLIITRAKQIATSPMPDDAGTELRRKEALTSVSAMLKAGGSFKSAAELAAKAGLQANEQKIDGATSDEAGRFFELALPNAELSHTVGPVTAGRDLIWIKLDRVEKEDRLSVEEARPLIEKELTARQRKRTWEAILENPASRHKLGMLPGNDPPS